MIEIVTMDMEFILAPITKIEERDVRTPEYLKMIEEVMRQIVEHSVNGIIKASNFLAEYEH